MPAKPQPDPALILLQDLALKTLEFNLIASIQEPIAARIKANTERLTTLLNSTFEPGQILKTPEGKIGKNKDGSIFLEINPIWLAKEARNVSA